MRARATGPGAERTGTYFTKEGTGGGARGFSESPVVSVPFAASYSTAS